MIDKVKVSAAEALAPVKDGAVIMIGGFMGCGTPEILIDALTARGVKELTVICGDACYPGRGTGKLLDAGMIKTLIASHVGMNPEVARRAATGSLELILVPQGTFAERIRSGGAGLGGVLTPAGAGTLAAEGKQIITVEGRDYLLEKSLRADFALVRASKIDRAGNIVFYGTTKNYNPMMASAADYVIAAACEIVETGEIDPNIVHVPGTFVDAIVGGEKPVPAERLPAPAAAPKTKLPASGPDTADIKEIIARRAARELKDGDVVNLGIGIPALAANYIPPGVDLWLQSENGMMGMGSAPETDKVNPDIVNAGGFPVTAVSGAAFFDSAASFGIIRGGHVDATILGALEVDQEGNIANWIVPGKKVPGMGGAMDLVVGAKKVIVAMTHTQNGRPKILKRCTLPLTAAGVVDMIITEMGVIEVSPEGLVLTELGPGFTVEQVKAATEADLRIGANLKSMQN